MSFREAGGSAKAARAERALELASAAAALLGGAAGELVAVLRETQAIQPAEFPESAWLFASAWLWRALFWSGLLVHGFHALRGVWRERADRVSVALRLLGLLALGLSALDGRARLPAVLACAALGARVAAREPRRATPRLDALERAGLAALLRRAFPALALWCSLALAVPALAEVGSLPGGGPGVGFALTAAASGGLWLALLGTLALALAQRLLHLRRPADTLAALGLAWALGTGVALGGPQPLASGALGALFLVGATHLAAGGPSERGARAALPLVAGTMLALRLRALWLGVLEQEISALGIGALATGVLACGGWVCAGLCARRVPRLVALGLALLLAVLSARAATPRFADFSAVTAPIHASMVSLALALSLALLPRGRRSAFAWERAGGVVVLLLGAASIVLAQRAAEEKRVRHALLGDAPFALAAWIAAPRFPLARDPALARPERVEEGAALELQGRYPQVPEAERFRARRPPIVIFLWDGVRPERCGFGGSARATTPNADRFARESVVFEQARANATATTASMRMLLSGRYQARTMLARDHAPLFLGELWELGYRRFLVNVHGSDYNGIGREAFLRGLGPATAEIERATTFFEEYDEEAKARRAVALLDMALAEDRGRGVAHPLDGTLLFLHSAATHFPWRSYPGVPEFGAEPADRFDHALAHVDRWSAYVWQALRERGVYDDALQVLTADHGVGLGERGRPGGFLPWEEQVRVPLVIKAPGFAPRRVGEPVASIDIVPTLLSLFRPGAAHDLHGFSLVELMSGRAETLSRRNIVSLASFVDGYALLDVRERMVLLFFRAAGHRMLFDLARDPLQRVDLAEKRAPLARRYVERLHHFLAAGPWDAPEHYRRSGPAAEER
ncbi:MAG: sulfatase-like hydrolase/transferase [Planctomycetes bacterium]|nr:sulfatase-like hydrolase/transferase [Planctomycetota bacterium]